MKVLKFIFSIIFFLSFSMIIFSQEINQFEASLSGKRKDVSLSFIHNYGCITINNIQRSRDDTISDQGKVHINSFTVVYPGEGFYKYDEKVLGPCLSNEAIDKIHQLLRPGDRFFIEDINAYDEDTHRPVKIKGFSVQLERMKPRYPPKALFEVKQEYTNTEIPVQFIDKSTYAPKMWHWDFGDGDTSDLQNPEHIYKSPGKYDVSLQVINDDGSDKIYKKELVTVGGTTMDQPCPGSPVVTDYDGNVYKTVLIGNQCWMKENLKTTHYSNGEPLVNGKKRLNITNDDTSRYYFAYNDDKNNIEKYGLLYTWAAALNGTEGSETNPSGIQGVCPEGWHLPSGLEWNTLINYLGGYTIAGLKMKAQDGPNNTIGSWETAGSGGTNESGFTALPAGIRYNECNCKTKFEDLGVHCYFISATEYNEYQSTGCMLYKGKDNTGYYWVYKGGGASSVRCIKD